MSESSLGTGEHIYTSLEAGYGVVPDGPLQGVTLHVPRANPNWKLPEGARHLYVPGWSPQEEIKQLIDQSFAEAQRTGACYVPADVLKYFYDQAKVADTDERMLDMQAGFETSYVIKGLSYCFPYQMQRVIELNTARAIIGSYRDPEVPSGYGYTLRDNLVPMGLKELHDFFASVEERFKNRADRSQIGTDALVDEIDRLAAQVMNERWAVFALPKGDGLEASQQPAATPRKEHMTTEEEVTSTFGNLVAAIGSERIMQWELGSTLDELGKYCLGAAFSGGEQNPYEELTGKLTTKLRAAEASEKAKIKELLRQLHDLGHAASLYSRAR